MEQSELVVTLLFLAWHVRMESRSDLSSLSNVKTFSTFNWDGLTKVSSMMVCTSYLGSMILELSGWHSVCGEIRGYFIVTAMP